MPSQRSLRGCTLTVALLCTLPLSDWMHVFHLGPQCHWPTQGLALTSGSLQAEEPRLLAPQDAQQLAASVIANTYSQPNAGASRAELTDASTPSAAESSDDSAPENATSPTLTLAAAQRWPLRPLDVRALQLLELDRKPEQPSLARTRTITERYPQGSVRTSRQVITNALGDTENHGLWQWFDTAGQPLARGYFWQGQRQGHWQRWLQFEDAPLLKQLPYREFSPPLLSQVEFRDDRMHGTWEVLDARGRLVSAIELVDGDRHGKAIWWYPSGQKMLEMNYLQGSLDGDHLTWNPDGTLIGQKRYQLGRELRVQTRKFPSGAKQIDEGIALPKLVPNVRDHWWNMTLATYRTEGHTAKHGITRQWHANGQLLMEGEFDLDEPVGIHTWWHENGNKLSVGEYRMGRRERLWTWWHPNGQVSQQGNYDVGVAIGQWTAWSQDGSIVRQDEADPFMRSGSALDQIIVPSVRQALRPVKPTQPLVPPRLLPE